MCQRQHIRRLASQQFSVRPDLIGFRVDIDFRGRIVQQHRFLTNATPRILYGQQLAIEAELLAQACIQSRLADESDRTGGQ